MRFKYYLRGAGIGVIVATLVLSIAFLFHDNISDEEVIRRAMKLGMVMQENTPGTLADMPQGDASSVDLETGADKERPPMADAAPLDAKPDAAPEPSAPSNTDSPVPAPMPTATSGNTIIAIVILVALAGGSALYGIVTRKNLQ